MKSASALTPWVIMSFVVCLTAPFSNASDQMGNSAAEPFTPREYAAAVRETIDGYTVHATLGPANTPLTLGLSNFLLDHPDLAAFIINRRHIAPYKIVMQGPMRSSADDGEGTEGIVNMLSATDHRRLYYGEGIHHSLMFPDIHASAVIIMELKQDSDESAHPTTTTTFEVYVRMHNRFVAGVVKTLRPFLQKTVVGKFSKAFFVADQVGRLIASDPQGVIEDADAFPLIFVDDRRALRDMISRMKAPAP